MGDHYVPRFYLRGFSVNDYLWVHDRLRGVSFKSVTKSVANENDMYGDEVEKLLANKIENPAKLAIESIRTGQRISSADREALARYIIILWKRVPKGRERAAAQMPEVAESVRRDLHAQLGHLAQLDPDNERQAIAKREEIDRIINRYVEELPSEIWQRGLAAGGTGRPESVLLGMNWNFLQSRNAEFLTCDHPVFFFEHEGMGSPKAELTLPLSSSVCLWAHKLGNRQPDFYEARSAAIKEINRRTAHNATRFVYSAGNAAWILPFIQKSHELNRLAF